MKSLKKTNSARKAKPVKAVGGFTIGLGATEPNNFEITGSITGCFSVYIELKDESGNVVGSSVVPVVNNSYNHTFNNLTAGSTIIATVFCNDTVPRTYKGETLPTAVAAETMSASSLFNQNTSIINSKKSIELSLKNPFQEISDHISMAINVTHLTVNSSKKEIIPTRLINKPRLVEKLFIDCLTPGLYLVRVTFTTTNLNADNIQDKIESGRYVKVT